MDNNPSLNELIDAFPLEFPVIFRLTDSYDDAAEETEPFSGLFWNNVNWLTIKNKFEASCFFSPEAFHYYFPSFVIASQSSLDDVEMAIDYLLSVLSDTEDLSLKKWKDERWSLFTRKQVYLMFKWMIWLKTTKNAISLHNLDKAREALLRRLNTIAPNFHDS